MKLLDLLTRTVRRPKPEPAPPPVRPAVGIDYLFGRTAVKPAAPEPEQDGIAPQALPPPPDPVTLDGLEAAAKAAEARWDWLEADRIWRMARDSFPDVFYGYTAGATALSNYGRRDDARALLDEAAGRFPHERAIPLEAGRLAMEWGDWKAAERHWRAALTFDARPWWAYSELARALEQQGRITEAEDVLFEGQARADEADEITLSTYPARLAGQRQDWATAVARWAEAQRRHPGSGEVRARLHEALLRLSEHDQAAYEAALLTLGITNRPIDQDDGRALILRFESLGGTGPDGGREFACFLRARGAEPAGLFCWAAVSPASLIAALNDRFARMGEPDWTVIAPREGQWEITDTAYGTKMPSFVPCSDVAHDQMLAVAAKRMHFLKEKLIADLEKADKVFVLQHALKEVPAAEIEQLDQAMRAYGDGQLLCVCPADIARAPGRIDRATPNISIGYLDFTADGGLDDRHAAWEGLCRAMLPQSAHRPVLPQIVFERGHAAMRAGQWAEAEAHWRDALANGDAPWWVFTELARSLEEQGRTDEAEAVLLDGQARDPAQISLPLNLARLAERRQDDKAAERHWREALEIDPVNWSAHRLLADLLRRHDRMAESEALLEACKARYPDQIGPFAVHALLADDQRDWDSSLARWQHVRTAFPDRPEGYDGAIRALRNLGRLQEAAPILEEAGGKFPDASGILMETARLAALIGWRDQALATFAEVRRRFPDIVGATVEADEVLRSLERFTEAEALLADALRKQPRNWLVWRQIGTLAEARGDWAKAVAHWTEMGRQFPRHEAETWRLHQAILRLAETDPDAADRAAGEDGDPAESLRALALSFESLGGSGPAGGCEFGGVQRACGAEPMGLLRWASVTPANLVACLSGRFDGVGDAETTELYLNADDTDRLWQIRDTRYGFAMHSFVAEKECPFDRMIVAAQKRMRYLAAKLRADLETPTKLFVLKLGDRHLTEHEAASISEAMRSIGPGQVLCACPADASHPPGSIEQRADAVWAGYLDFSDGEDYRPRHPAWLALCRTAIDSLPLSRRTYPATVQ